MHSRRVPATSASSRARRVLLRKPSNGAEVALSRLLGAGLAFLCILGVAALMSGNNGVEFGIPFAATYLVIGVGVDLLRLRRQGGPSQGGRGQSR